MNDPKKAASSERDLAVCAHGVHRAAVDLAPLPLNGVKGRCVRPREKEGKGTHRRWLLGSTDGRATRWRTERATWRGKGTSYDTELGGKEANDLYFLAPVGTNSPSHPTGCLTIAKDTIRHQVNTHESLMKTG